MGCNSNPQPAPKRRTVRVPPRTVMFVKFSADVLYYNGDWAPNLVEPKHVDPALGKGYDYDVCNA